MDEYERNDNRLTESSNYHSASAATGKGCRMTKYIIQGGPN